MQVELPREIYREIFKFLDAKTLLGISAVCKTWKAVLEDEQFWQARVNKAQIPVPANGSTTNSKQVFLNFFIKKEAKIYLRLIFQIDKNLCKKESKKSSYTKFDVVNHINHMPKYLNMFFSEDSNALKNSLPVLCPSRKYFNIGFKVTEFQLRKLKEWSKEKAGYYEFIHRVLDDEIEREMRVNFIREVMSINNLLCIQEIGITSDNQIGEIASLQFDSNKMMLAFAQELSKLMQSFDCRNNENSVRSLKDIPEPEKLIATTLQSVMEKLKSLHDSQYLPWFLSIKEAVNKSQKCYGDKFPIRKYRNLLSIIDNMEAVPKIEPAPRKIFGLF